MFWFFGHEACGILAPRPGIEPAPPALEGKVLTTGPPGKSLIFLFIQNIYHQITSCYGLNCVCPTSPNTNVEALTLTVTVFGDTEIIRLNEAIRVWP